MGKRKMTRDQQKAMFAKKYKGYGITKGKTPDGLTYYQNVGRKKTGGYDTLDTHDTLPQAKKKHEELMGRNKNKSKNRV